jgi:hypothetical protein
MTTPGNGGLTAARHIGNKLTVFVAYDMDTGEIHVLPESPNATLLEMVDSKRLVEIYETSVEVKNEELVMTIEPGVGKIFTQEKVDD